jgi:predicted RNase H-like HicB family nuclease
MKRQFTAAIEQEGKWYVAQCLEVDVASQGATEEEALRNLAEALALYFDEPRDKRLRPS